MIVRVSVLLALQVVVNNNATLRSSESFFMHALGWKL